MPELPLIQLIAAAFFTAWVFGLFAQYVKLSPIVGYLVAGIVIGPYTPGFAGDKDLAHQLAEVGVILLMFGVGMHFHLKDLLAVKGVAIPGALGQVTLATAGSVLLFHFVGLSWQESFVIGIALSVASTVVLIRVLMDNNVMQTPEGHVSVGWLLVEDLLTVFVLVMITAIGTATGGAALPTDNTGNAVHAVAQAAEEVAPIAGHQVEQLTETLANATAASSNPWVSLGIAMLNLVIFLVISFVLGTRIIPWALERVARLRSQELFTLTVLVFSIAISAWGYLAFGVTMAMGAFIAGMMVALSPVSHQAAADALPLRDTFAVIFFVSVGMVFNPAYLVQHPTMIAIALVVILIIKPLAALLIVLVMGWSVRTALTVALALSQVGEFSFILSDAAEKVGMLSSASHSVLVASAIITITMNPMLFRLLPTIEAWLRRHPKLWKFLNRRADARLQKTNSHVAEAVSTPVTEGEKLAVVVGYGPVGRSVNSLLKDAGIRTVVVDMNMDAVNEANRQNQLAVFGDGTREPVLEQAGVARASYLIVTLPQSSGAGMIIHAAKNLNPDVRVIVRARYLRERTHLEEVGAYAAVYEEGEAAIALSKLVLADLGSSQEIVKKTIRDLRLRMTLAHVHDLSKEKVRDLMVPWPRVKRLYNTQSMEQIRHQLSEERFSRWPVVDSVNGKVLGFIHIKDLAGDESTGTEWTRHIQEIPRVAIDLDIQSLLLRFQSIAYTICVVETLGRPVGVVTIEDIAESSLNRIENEYPVYPEFTVSESVQYGGVQLEMTSTMAEEAIVELSDLIPAALVDSREKIAELAINRERELSTDVGMGIAIPHARCSGLKKPLLVFGRSHDGIVFNKHSADPVRLVFLLVTPDDKPELQVIMLGKLASLVGTPEIRDQLMEATTSMDVYDILGR